MKNFDNRYYWIDTDFHYGDFSVPKFALFGGKLVDGVKDRDTEELLFWSAYEDLDGSDADDWKAIDDWIIDKLGFLPDYEVN